MKSRGFHNDHVRIVKSPRGPTQLWIKRHDGKFQWLPDMTFKRELTDDECMDLLANPWQIFDKPFCMTDEQDSKT